LQQQKKTDNRELINSGSVATVERKRKCSAASDESRKKVKKDKKSQSQSRVLTNDVINSFDSKRILDTAMFLEDMQAIHHWDDGVIITGEQHTIKSKRVWKAHCNVSQDRIERLEEIVGFQWWQGIDYNEAFEKRCRELIAFKEDFGHCNVYRRHAGNPSLGTWCNTIRSAYTKIQKGMQTNSNLSQDRIERLEEIGFQWKGCVTFEERCRELTAFKDKLFEQCLVPSRYAANPSLGHWCSDMRMAYKGTKVNSNLSQDRIERLEEIGHKWKV
jgi:hypothetical protein